MLDRSLLIKDGEINYGYLLEWCALRGAKTAGDPAGGWQRILFTGPEAKKPLLFWLPRIFGPGAGQPLRAAWRQGCFAGPDAYLPGMLSVLLEVAAGAARGMEIIISLGDTLPGGLDPRGVYYFLAPTDFQLALAHKGEYQAVVSLSGARGGQFGRQGDYEEENSFFLALEKSLAPAHPIYPVGPEAPELVRPFFLLGHRQAVLKSLAREGEELVLTYRINTLPGDGPDEVTQYLKAALSAAGRPNAGLAVTRVHPGGRSAAGHRDLEPLYRAYSRVTGLQPDIDWFGWPSAAGALSGMGFKTAAFGPGRYPDYLAGSAFDPAGGEKLGQILRELLAGTNI